MGEKIDLPGGGWAEIKDPEELTNRDRKLLRRHLVGAREVMLPKFTKLGLQPGTDPATIPAEVREQIGELLSADDMDTVDLAQAALIVAYVANWSLTTHLGEPRSLPTLDTVDDLPAPIFDALAKATANLGDGSLDTSVDGALDPGSPTGPSAG